MKKQVFFIVLAGLLCTQRTKTESRIASVAESAGFGLALGYATGLVPPLGVIFALPTTMLLAGQQELERNTLLGFGAIGFTGGIATWYKGGQWLGNRYFNTTKGGRLVAVPLLGLWATAMMFKNL